jgi:hypothetical protein
MAEMLQLELVIHSIHAVTCSGIDEGEKMFKNFSRCSGKDEDDFLIGNVFAMIAIDRQ